MLQRLLFCVSILLSGSSAQYAYGAGGAAPVDPKADRLLKQMSQSLTEAREFTFEAYQMSDYILDSGQKIQLSDFVSIAVKRPNKVWAESTGDTKNEKVWYNSKTLTVLNKLDNTYGIANVPENIDKMLDYVNENFRATLPTADLIVSDPYKSAIANVLSGEYLGLHYVGKVKCHHLAFRQEGLDWQIWIQDQERPLPLQLAITFKDSPGHPQFVAFFKNWNLSPKLSDDIFVSAIPRDAKQIDLIPTTQPAGEKSIPQSNPKAKGNVNNK